MAIYITSIFEYSSQFAIKPSNFLNIFCNGPITDYTSQDLRNPIIMSTVATLLKTKGCAIWHTHPDHSVFDAISIMEEKSVGALAVIKDDKLIGIISERDYARQIVLKGRSSKETLVKEIMTSQVLITHRDQSINDCMVLMTEKKIRHLPVIEDEKIIAMISLGDVVKEIIHGQEIKIKELENYITWEESY